MDGRIKVVVYIDTEGRLVIVENRLQDLDSDRVVVKFWRSLGSFNTI